MKKPRSKSVAAPFTGASVPGTSVPGASATAAALSPRSILLPYQRAWSADTARWKIGLMARQVGKDFSSGEEGIRDCVDHEVHGTKTTWLIGAPSERQSLESLEKWKEWALAYKLAIADIHEEREGGKSEAMLKSATITFPNGSRVIAVPGRPDTVRGYSANILLTEFAFFEDPDATWRAVLPSVTNPLRGGLKKVRLISTPNGQGNKFHELWTKNYNPGSVAAPFMGASASAGGKWSCHKINIWDAVAQGLPIDPYEIRAALDDPEGWAQEFECEFLDSSAVLLPYELIIPCETPQATETCPTDFWSGSQPSTLNPQLPSRSGSQPSTLNPQLFLGLDFGRKQDLTVCWSLEAVTNNFHLTREVLTLSKTSTDRQLEILRPRLTRAARVSFDYTGPGVGLGDFLVKEFGEFNPTQHKFGKIELCQFTGNLKRDLFPKLRMAFDQKQIGIPVSRLIREDLHSLHRVATLGGDITYRAPHTPDGHADRCTALALALRAASFGTATNGIRTLDGFRWGKMEN